jgi:hypothetical protein
MMKGTARARLLLSVAAIAVVTLLGLSACGRLSGTNQANAPTDSSYSSLDWDAQALQSLGFSPSQVSLVADDVRATPSASASPGTHAGNGANLRRLRHRLLRFGFGNRLEHGEATVQTDNGTKDVVVQRGSVTAITDTSVTVRSADGFTLTWTFGNPFTVIKDQAKIQPNSVPVGAHVGIAGSKDGSAVDARLMVVVQS